MTTNTQTISTETILRLVADPRRRTILRQLRENDSVIAVEDLTGVATERGAQSTPRAETDPPAPRTDEQRVTRAELHHTHLPQLADAGVIEYDSRTGTVRYRSHDRVEALLGFVSSRLES
ncbi:hypothetical protein HALLA_16215 [Halostagnicola larsenii XH-48]|uniref:DUF7344 domain-containing protein n=1 Tax=Halostagnicola larsenii XH-48 TaxID=797299 RepID=W0JSX4_9EURY|nr:hypothetical protein [Halostagnicola larsenii]AHG00113.1 hypothetical protein HALLA_16215 [Halostagnicola larsenii XH-48]